MTSGQPYQIGGSTVRQVAGSIPTFPKKWKKGGTYFDDPSRQIELDPFLEDKKVLKGGHMLCIYRGDSLISKGIHLLTSGQPYQ